MNVTQIVDFLVEQGELVDQDIVDEIEKILQSEEKDEKLLLLFKKEFPEVNSSDLFKIYDEDNNGKVSIIKSYEKTPGKHTVQDFVRYFIIRFKSLEKLLRSRPELTGLTSISRVKTKTDKEKVSVIGMIIEKHETKNGHIILSIEDLSGSIKVLINKDNADLIAMASDFVLDEVIGIVGRANSDIIFSELILQPDVPYSKELKKSPQDHYAIFSGDTQFGSHDFMHKEFHRFLLWINGKLGTAKQREIASKVKYFIHVGDVVDGVGIYPGQEEDLSIKDIKSQYALAAEYLKKIPSHIKIIICPGNHDVGRIAEPQFPIEREYAKDLWDLPNVIMVSNPSYISLDVSNDFSGIDVLLYHGGSLPYYADNISSIRSKGGLKCSDEIMVHLLKLRHLAPSHGSTLYVPDILEDPLVIDPLPDIFITGHIHRSQTKSYRNITCINSSTWLDINEDQEKRGIEPQPCRVFAISLKTRELKIMNFSTHKDVKTVAERHAQIENVR